jgi:hypothetical protein
LYQICRNFRRTGTNVALNITLAPPEYRMHGRQKRPEAGACCKPSAPVPAGSGRYLAISVANDEIG